MRMSMGRGRVAWPVVIAAAVAMALAGCGSGDDDNATESTAGTPTAAAQATTSGDPGMATAEKNLQALYDGSDFKEPPSQSPKPKPGEKIAVVTVGQASPAGVAWAKGVKEAGKELGWDVTVFDGMFTPAKWLEGVQQAVASKVDGIVLIAIDCAPVKAGLEQARAAGIKVISVVGTDCNEVDPSAKPLFDGTAEFSIGDSLHAVSERIGAAQADWVTEKTDGKGKVILVGSSQLIAHKWLSDGFKAELAKVCSGCSIVEQVDFAIPDLVGPGLRQKVEQALLKHPDANAFVAAIDEVVISSGGDAAIRNTGRSDQINVIGSAAYPQSIAEIKANKGLDASVAIPLEWEAWGGMDAMNRVLNGQKPEPTGLALGLVDQGHNDQNPSGYVPPIDYKAAYRKAWQGQ